MKYDWYQWLSVAQGSAKPGTPVTVSRYGERFALFVADKSGSVYTIGGAPGAWGDWTSVSQGQTTPGGRISAGWDGQAFQLFLADPRGGVYTVRGTPDQGWGDWSSVSQGSTTPGAPVTAVWDGHAFQLFLADPAGGVYTLRGTVSGWGDWSSVSQGSTKPGAPVTAVWDGKLFQLFLADPGGGVYTLRGSAAAGWGPWSSVSQGGTTPGAPVTAVWNGKYFQLFCADTKGGIYTVQGNPGAWGPWKSISQGASTPGAPVTAVWDGERFAVIVADSGGSVFAAFGTTEFGWTAWSSVAQGSTIPGGPVTASWNYNDTQMSLFLCDPNGGVYTIATRGPDAPTNLHVVSVTDSTIDIAWTDNSGDQDGFRVSYGGSGSPKSFPPGARSASLTGLQSGQTYAISVVAFNDSTDVSASSNVINVTTDAAPQAASITAVVTLVPSDGTNAYALVVTGANFASGETVDLSIVWTLDDTGTYNDTVQALGGSLGAGTFSFPFFGNTPDGLCGGTNPNTDEQTFQVQAKGQTSGSTATATARFACP